MAEALAVADNDFMRFVCGFCVFAVSFVVGCPGPSTFIPDEPDGGTPDDVVTADEIGVPCVYDPATGDNPTNQCPAGTDCVIVTSDGAFNTLGLALGFWEDQFTVATEIDGAPVDIGYCSIIGSAQAPPVCPIGTVQKFFTAPQFPGGFSAMCLRPCGGSAECGSERVCDVRFVDPGLDQLAFCVSPCRSDLSHCVRSAIISITQEVAATGLFADDLFGGATCNLQTGICSETNHIAQGGNDGAQCSTSSDCAIGHACYQSQLFFDPPDLGFCAQRCTQFIEGNQTQQGTCEAGEICQPGMAFGYPDMIAFDFSGNAPLSLEGICLDICVEGVTECEPGASCGATDASVTGQPWQQVEMCVPPAIREPT